jgi:hypothetical protein
VRFVCVTVMLYDATKCCRPLTCLVYGYTRGQKFLWLLEVASLDMAVVSLQIDYVCNVTN